MNPARALLALVLAAAALPASAQTKPDISEKSWLDFDIAAMKAGEWVKRRLEREGEPALEYKVACVAVEGDVAWIEEDRSTVEYFPGTVVLCSIGRTDRKVTRAFWGKPGEAGKDVTLSRGGHMDPGNEAATGTATVAPQIVTMKGKEHKAERIEIKTEAEGLGSTIKTRQLIVDAEGIPFPLHCDDKGVVRASIQEGRIAWTGTPTWKGGLVTMEFEGSVKWKLTLLDHGTDAKATLRKQ